ncbi:MAG TPA: class I SAM-dependent methyltransferase [Chitinophagaceae bacterium]
MPALEPHITHDFPTRNGMANHDGFQDLYLALRKKENRLYTDEQVSRLPIIESSHPHYKEWLARKRSLDKLTRYIRGLRQPLNILEVGCGNGWLANRLSEIPGTTVTGFDINLEEVQQAIRVFGKKTNLRFRTVNPFSFNNDETPYDIVVFAASIQYFPSLDAIIYDALGHLKPGGSIHIIDTHFYIPEEVPAARQRTIDHFTALGYPGMSDYYFHHSLVTLSKFDYIILYDPQSWHNKLFGGRSKNPFYWIMIKKI